jgi:hypothetical protein
MAAVIGWECQSNTTSKSWRCLALPSCVPLVLPSAKHSSWWDSSSTVSTCHMHTNNKANASELRWWWWWWWRRLIAKPFWRRPRSFECIRRRLVPMSRDSGSNADHPKWADSQYPTKHACFGTFGSVAAHWVQGQRSFATIDGSFHGRVFLQYTNAHGGEINRWHGGAAYVPCVQVMI